MRCETERVAEVFAARVWAQLSGHGAMNKAVSCRVLTRNCKWFQGSREGPRVQVVTPRGTRCSRDPGAPARPTSHCNALQELILIQIFLRLVKGALPFQ